MGIEGEIQIPETLVASSPSVSRSAARAPRRACSQATLIQIILSTLLFSTYVTSVNTSLKKKIDEINK